MKVHEIKPETSNRFCYHYLQNDVHGKVVVERINDHEVRVSLPHDMIRSYVLNVSVKDPRVLVCFDGDIPSGGLPKGSTVLLKLPTISERAISPLTCNIAVAYKKRHPSEESSRYTIMDEKAAQPISRHFILLKTGRALFRKYKKTLQPVYLIVDVRNSMAEFSTSSY